MIDWHSFSTVFFSRKQRRWAAPLTLLALVCAAGIASASPPPEKAPPLELKQGDRVVFIGNTFAERLALFSHFETLVTALYPEHELSFRNMGWSADTLSLQPRPLNFGDMDSHLEKQKADVIIACYGMNEAFEGRAGLARFEQDWEDFLQGMSEARFNGESAPRIAIISPIAHEALGGKLPGPAAHNKNLRLYTETMRRIAAGHGLPFADLFTPTSDLSGPPLTRNGIHLNRYGDWVTAQIMAQELGLTSGHSLAVKIDAERHELPIRFRLDEHPPLPPPPAGAGTPPVDLRPLVVVKGLAPGRYVLQVNREPVVSGSAADWARGVRIRSGPTAGLAEGLRRTVVEKEEQFFYRWRPVNGEYIYGRRREPFGVINFPKEMEALDKIVAGLDRKIWRLSKDLTDASYELVKAAD